MLQQKGRKAQGQAPTRHSSPADSHVHAPDSCETCSSELTTRRFRKCSYNHTCKNNQAPIRLIAVQCQMPSRNQAQRGSVAIKAAACFGSKCRADHAPSSRAGGRCSGSRGTVPGRSAPGPQARSTSGSLRAGAQPWLPREPSAGPAAERTLRERRKQAAPVTDVHAIGKSPSAQTQHVA
jgi:hypothetical protein